MLSKLIAYAPTREQAIRRMRRALDEYFIGGIASNLGLFRKILDDEDFIAARIDTGYLDRLLSSRVPEKSVGNGAASEKIAAIAAALMEFKSNGKLTDANGLNRSTESGEGKWKRIARQEALRDR